MKRGTESIVRLGKSVEPADFSGINVLSTVILGKKESATKDFNGLFITDAVMLGKKISHAAVVTATVHGVSPLSLPSAVANSLAYVKAFGGTEQRNLPDGYTQLEYIESTGTQYIDPDVSGDARWVITAQTNAIKGSSQPLIYSTPPASGGTWYGEFTNTGHWDIVSGGTNIPPTTKTTADLTFDGNGARGTIGSTSVNRSVTVTQGNWRIFGNSISVGLFAGKLFDAKVYQNGTLVRNFVPAKNSSNVVGMYDTVSGQFFTNQGSGDFVAGPEAVPTPDTPMNIVSNNGVLKASRNLFDGRLEQGAFGSSTGLPVDNENWVRTSDYITVSPGTTYTISTDAITGKTIEIYIVEYDGNGDFIRMVTGVPGNIQSWTTNASCSKINFQLGFFPREAVTPNVFSRIQLEQSSTVTPYTPYSPTGIYTDGTVETIEDSLSNTATTEMLLKVGNYQDVQSILDGVVTRNVGVKVLDGTENWSDFSSYYALSVGNIATGSILCTHFQNDSNFGIIVVSARFRAYVASIYTTLDSWKQYLADQYAAGTPVIVIYPLATATTESVAGQTLQVADGDNTLEITQASMTGLELEAQYQKRT